VTLGTGWAWDVVREKPQPEDVTAISGRIPGSGCLLSAWGNCLCACLRFKLLCVGGLSRYTNQQVSLPDLDPEDG
jgi:hypothetical protein